MARMGYQKPKAPVFDGTALPATSRDQKARARARPDAQRIRGKPEARRRHSGTRRQARPSPSQPEASQPSTSQEPGRETSGRTGTSPAGRPDRPEKARKPQA